MGSVPDILTSSKEANETGKQLVLGEEQQRERKPQRWQGDRAQIMRPLASQGRWLSFWVREGNLCTENGHELPLYFIIVTLCALLRKDYEGVRDGRKQRNQLGICWNIWDKNCQWLGHKSIRGDGDSWLHPESCSEDKAFRSSWWWQDMGCERDRYRFRDNGFGLSIWKERSSHQPTGKTYVRVWGQSVDEDWGENEEFNFGQVSSKYNWHQNRNGEWSVWIEESRDSGRTELDIYIRKS